MTSHNEVRPPPNTNVELKHREGTPPDDESKETHALLRREPRMLFHDIAVQRPVPLRLDSRCRNPPHQRVADASCPQPVQAVLARRISITTKRVGEALPKPPQSRSVRKPRRAINNPPQGNLGMTVSAPSRTMHTTKRQERSTRRAML